MQSKKPIDTLVRIDERIILHFDYDCFYASVFESENPHLKSRPLAVQQKQIIVTCNYEARRRGLRKLQLITDAKKICPDVIIVLGEDISRFRDASKKLYQTLSSFSWNNRAERLGFDEVWLDMTDMVDYNLSLLNQNALADSFFVLDQQNPTEGFSFDATCYAGPTYPEKNDEALAVDEYGLALRLRLGSHLGMYLRIQLEQQTGYTSTVGVSTSKLLSKLVGTLNKPKDQTTLLPPYRSAHGRTGNVTTFIDDLEVGKIPGIGFKLAQKLRKLVLHRDPEFDNGLVYGDTKEHVTTGQVRLAPGLDPKSLEKILSGPGAPHGIGSKIWSLLHGIDDTEVALARSVPKQISIEDSYIRLDTLPELLKELRMLSCSIVNRMRVDLLNDGFDDGGDGRKAEDAPATATGNVSRRWLAHPKTIRLSTRPRLPLNPDGTRTRSFKRISHSAPLPNFVFSLTDSVEAIAERLVQDTLVPMFRRLHPEKAGWNLSLVNIAITNMAEAAGESKTANGRDIGNMFKRQESVLKEFSVYDDSKPPNASPPPLTPDNFGGSDEQPAFVRDISDVSEDDEWTSDGDGERCEVCGASVPSFAMSAHKRFHLFEG